MRMARITRQASAFKRAIAEGDYIVLHCFQEWPGIAIGRESTSFRLDADSKVVEHWDVLQDRASYLRKSRHDVLASDAGTNEKTQCQDHFTGGAANGAPVLPAHPYRAKTRPFPKRA